MIRDLIKFLLSNFTLTFFVVGLLGALFSIYRHRAADTKGMVNNILLKYYCLFAIGITFLYNGIFHVWFHQMAARFIGWEDSPFQIEVGTASLGFGLVGLLAARNDFGLRLAAILGPAVFLWGAAIGHIYQMVSQNNFSPGNAGIIFYSDLLIPLFGFVLLYRARKTTN
jgi:hypothetical protein